MRQFIIATAMALGLVALWAAILPLTAQPAPPAANSQAMSKALFLCRGANGIDRTCATALARALVLDSAEQAPAQVSDRHCRVDATTMAMLEQRH